MLNEELKQINEDIKRIQGYRKFWESMKETWQNYVSHLNNVIYSKSLKRYDKIASNFGNREKHLNEISNAIKLKLRSSRNMFYYYSFTGDRIHQYPMPRRLDLNVTAAGKRWIQQNRIDNFDRKIRALKNERAKITEVNNTLKSKQQNLDRAKNDFENSMQQELSNEKRRLDTDLSEWKREAQSQAQTINNQSILLRAIKE